MTAKLSPAMEQFMAAKREHPDALVFFRMGDFYELFFDDAKEASKALGITLTARNKGGDNPIPMAGVPVRSAETYLKRLVQGGYKVAICEQMQDPKEVKGLVDRQIVRVMTPGTLTEDNLLDDARANYLAAATSQRGRVGIAWVELSTGAFFVHELPETRLLDELSRLAPAELLVPEGGAILAAELPDLPLTWRSPYDFGHDTAERALLEFFGTSTLDGFGVQDAVLAVGAAGALIAYLKETQLAALPHIRASRSSHGPADAARPRDEQQPGAHRDDAGPGQRQAAARRPRPDRDPDGRAPAARAAARPVDRRRGDPDPAGRGRGAALEERPRCRPARRARRRARPAAADDTDLVRPRERPGPGRPPGQPRTAAGDPHDALGCPRAAGSAPSPTDSTPMEDIASGSARPWSRTHRSRSRRAD